MLGGGVRGVWPGCRGSLCPGRGASGSLTCGCSFGLGRGFVDEVGGEGGVEEEVVVLGDVGCAAMRAGAALWAAAASAAATAGRMEGMPSRCGLRAGGWRGLVVNLRPRGPIRSLPSRLRCAGLLQCVRACSSVFAGGEQFAWAAFEGRRGFGLGFPGCVRGVCAGLWAGSACHGA